MKTTFSKKQPNFKETLELLGYCPSEIDPFDRAVDWKKRINSDSRMHLIIERESRGKLFIELHQDYGLKFGFLHKTKKKGATLSKELKELRNALRRRN